MCGRVIAEAEGMCGGRVLSNNNDECGKAIAEPFTLVDWEAEPDNRRFATMEAVMENFMKSMSREDKQKMMQEFMNSMS